MGAKSCKAPTEVLFTATRSPLAFTCLIAWHESNGVESHTGAQAVAASAPAPYVAPELAAGAALGPVKGHKP